MKKTFKRLYKSHGFRFVICWLVTYYIRFVHYTSLRTLTVHPDSAPYMRGEKNAIFAFWHGRLLMIPMICPPKRKMHVMISIHGDGEIIATAMHNFGFGTLRGSSSRGGSRAAIGAVRVLQSGDNIAITPDGPRGPALQVQPGIVTISQMSKLPVIVCTFTSSRHKRMRSWDRFMLALPFGRIHYGISAPLFNMTKEGLEAEMVKMVQEIDSKL